MHIMPKLTKRLFVCLFVCLFVWGKTRKSILRSLHLIIRERMEVITPGSFCRWNQPGLELYPRLSCFSARKPPGEHSKTTCVTQRTLWCRFNQTRATCKNTVTQISSDTDHVYQSVVNTLQVDGLARISGLTQALHRRVLTTKITTPYALTLCCRGKNLKNHKHVQWVEITNCPPTKKI